MQRNTASAGSVPKKFATLRSCAGYFQTQDDFETQGFAGRAAVDIGEHDFAEERVDFIVAAQLLDIAAEQPARAIGTLAEISPDDHAVVVPLDQVDRHL